MFRRNPAHELGWRELLQPSALDKRMAKHKAGAAATPATLEPSANWDTDHAIGTFH